MNHIPELTVRRPAMTNMSRPEHPRHLQRANQPPTRTDDRAALGLSRGTGLTTRAICQAAANTITTIGSIGRLGHLRRRKQPPTRTAARPGARTNDRATTGLSRGTGLTTQAICQAAARTITKLRALEHHLRRASHPRPA